MDLTPEIIAIGTELATITGRMSVEAIFDKIRTVKQKGNKDEIIVNLEEMINELISDKNNLIHISEAYREYFIAQQITEKEIKYITESIVPLIGELIEKTDVDNSGKLQEGMDMIKAILSKETFNIMQILGFNFKKAVGEPLTELVGSMIRNQMSTPDLSMESKILEQQREIEYLKICQDEDAYNRLIKIFSKQ